MNYSVGSIADLISCQQTPNKIKIIEQKVKIRTQTIQSDLPLNSKKLKNKTLPKNTEQYSESQDKLFKKLESPKTEDNETFVKPNTYTPIAITNAEKRIKAKKSKQNVQDKLVHDMHKDRTVFVGNVAIGTTKTELRKRFSVYGRIESIRFRSVPVPDEKTSKKVAAIKQQFHKNRTSLHSYIKFASAEESQKALVENGRLYDAHHVRVAHCSDDGGAPRDASRAVFVGNLSFDCEEEDLWATFAPCGPIDSVRVVRDRRTSIGKGFGYVNFTSADAVQMALELDNNVAVRNRQLRISICNNNHHKEKKRAKKRKQSQSSETNNETPTKKKRAAGNFQGLKFTDMKKKKKFDKGTKQKMTIAKLFTPKEKQS